MTRFQNINERLGPAYIAPTIPDTTSTVTYRDDFSEPVKSSLKGRKIADKVWGLWTGNASINSDGCATTNNTLRAIFDAGFSDGEFFTTANLLTLSSSSSTGMVLRGVDSQNYFRFFVITGFWRLESVIKGVYKTVISGRHSLTKGKTVTLSAKLTGPLIELFIDGVAVGSLTTSLYVTATKCGLFSNNSGTRSWTDFEAKTSVTTTPEPTPEEDTRPTNYVAKSYPFPSTMKNIPARCNPYNEGDPNDDYGDYWSDSGQVAYVPSEDNPNGPGLAATRHYAHYRGVFATAPLPDAYRGSVTNPDPITKLPAYVAANNGALLKGVIAKVRSVNTTGNDAIVLWENGMVTVATTQTGHGSASYPFVKLPANKKAIDLAITSNNELALVIVVDMDTNLAQVAVIMLEGKYIPFHTFHEMGLPNQCSCSAMKLLGYVDLPMNKPHAISAACNGRWGGPSATNGSTLGQLDLTNSSTSYNLREGPWRSVIAKNGYCVVSSREENKIVVVDLTSIFTYIRESWISSTGQYSITKAEYAAGQWPRSFEEIPAIKPIIVYEQSLPRPCSVLCGHSIDRWTSDRYKFHVGLEAGEVAIFDASSIMARETYHRVGALKEMGRAFVGENPIHLTFGRSNDGNGTTLFPDNKKGDGLNNIIFVTCRKARKIVKIATMAGQLDVLAVYEDKKIHDPVHAVKCVRGNVLLVADFLGQQVVGIRMGTITNKRVTPNVSYPTALGNASYEITGFLAFKGYPHIVTTENVN